MTLGDDGQTKRKADMFWLFASLRGRISREPYWYGLILVNLVAVLVLRFFIPELAIDPETLHIAPLSTRSALVFMITVLASVWTTIAIIVKRAHDCGLTGLIAGFALVPLIGYILILFLGFTPGTAGSNNYGERTNAP